MAVVAVAAAVDKLLPLASGIRAATIPIAIAAGLGAAAVVLWRGRGARSLEGVALWIEERDPALRYALVTAIDPVIAPPAHHGQLHAIAGGINVNEIVGRATRRTLGYAVAATVTVAVILTLLHPRALVRNAESALSHRVKGAAGPMANRLIGYMAHVVPPAYSRMKGTTVREPGNVQALVGASITFEGEGSPEGVTVTFDSAKIAATDGNRGWAIGSMMPKTPAVLALHDRDYKVLVALEPRTDSAPDVRLQLPLHDTTYQVAPRGKLLIQASLGDDIGIHFGYVEYMLSSGSEESFTTRVMNGSRVPFDNARFGTLSATINLDTIKLEPGTVLHVRAVAYDYNDVTGPGIGVSETRTLKVAEKLDSTSINAAPPLPIDSMWISQRLLNMKTDTLIRTKREYDHGAFGHKSSAYSNAQETIRQKAIGVIGLLENNGEGGSFATDISSKLREVVNLMWTAREDLGIAQPDTAMPYMIKILKILDEIRLANRYYLRGILKPVPVNVARIRLSGKDSLQVANRSARTKLLDPNSLLVARLDAAVGLAHSAPNAAADSLVYIRVSTLTIAPALAAALQHAIELLRKGASVDTALSRVRLGLQPPTHMLKGPSEWGGVMR